MLGGVKWYVCNAYRRHGRTVDVQLFKARRSYLICNGLSGIWREIRLVFHLYSLLSRSTPNFPCL